MTELTCLNCGQKSYTASPKYAKTCPYCFNLGPELAQTAKELSLLIRRTSQLRATSISLPVPVPSPGAKDAFKKIYSILEGKGGEE